MRSPWAVWPLLLPLAVLFAVLFSLAFAGSPAPYEPPPYRPGPHGRGPDLVPESIRYHVFGPTATPWASMLLRGTVTITNPHGHVGLPATFTPTPTVTPTPLPTWTPEPTWTPLPVYPTWTPEPAYVAPAPASSAGGGGGDWQSIVCSYGWSCSEALYVISHESGGNPNATNPSSGACGLWQLYPCPAGGYDVATATAIAWGKYTACGGGSFECAWYRWW